MTALDSQWGRKFTTYFWLPTFFQKSSINRLKHLRFELFQFVQGYFWQEILNLFILQRGIILLLKQLHIDKTIIFWEKRFNEVMPKWIFNRMKPTRFPIRFSIKNNVNKNNNKFQAKEEEQWDQVLKNYKVLSILGEGKRKICYLFNNREFVTRSSILYVIFVSTQNISQNSVFLEFDTSAKWLFK